MSTDATLTDHATQYSETQQMCRAALGKLLTMTVAVAEAAARLVDLEDRALKVLANAAEAATQGMLAAPDSMEAAIEAGRVADTCDGLRDGVAARMASVTATFNMASRAVRLTAALALRTERAMRPAMDGRPAQDAQPARNDRDERDASAPGKVRARAPSRAERLGDNEQLDEVETESEDEIGDRPAEAIIRDVCRDLELLTAQLGGDPLPEAVPAVLAQAAQTAWPGQRAQNAEAKLVPERAREPDG